MVITMKMHNIIFLVVAIVSILLGSFIRWVAKDKIVFDVSIQVDADYRLAEKVDSFGDDWTYEYKVNNDVNSEDIDVVFTQSGKDYKKEGFTNLEDVYYSPMVILADNKFLDDYKDHQEYVSINSENSNKDVYYFDAYKLFNVALEGKTYKDSGLGNSDKEIVKFIIPDKTNAYYKDVVKFIYLTFNHGESLTQERINELKPKVDEFLSKSKMVSDISSYLTKDVVKNNFILTPEFTIRFAEDIDNFGIGNIKNTNAVKIDVVIKDDIKDLFIDEELKNSSSISRLYFRNKYFAGSFHFCDNTSNYVKLTDFVTPVEISEELIFE